MIGHLAVITSEAENSFIRTTWGDARGWLGAHDRAVEGTFVFVGGPETGLTPSYSNWKSGMPDNNGNNEDCLEMNAGWNDYICSNALQGYYIELDCPGTMLQGAYGCSRAYHTRSGFCCLTMCAIDLLFDV